MRRVHEALELDDVHKIEIANNAFGLKRRILREQRGQRFLLYGAFAQPADADNWLLDVLLSHGQFHADLISLWLAEMGLGPQWRFLVEEHRRFFEAPAHRAVIASLEPKPETHETMRLLMLAMLAGCGDDCRLEAVLLALLDAHAAGNSGREAQIAACGLQTFMWQRVAQALGYASAAPGVWDLAIWLFQTGYARQLDPTYRAGQQALVLLDLWRDSQRYRASFCSLSGEAARVLNVRADLAQRSHEERVGIDLFEAADEEVTANLLRLVSTRTISSRQVSEIVRHRRSSPWYEQHRHLYEGLAAAAALAEEISRAALTVNSLADGVRKYTATWHRIDRLYGELHRHREAQGSAALAGLADPHYSTLFLTPLSQAWQDALDAAGGWAVARVAAQRDFYAERVAPAVGSRRVAVIVSDGLRYELGVALAERLQREDRLEVRLDPMLATLPSFTQLGMAALLPHKTLTLQRDGTVLVDGQRSTGLEARDRALKAVLPDAAEAWSVNEVRSLSRDALRERLKDLRLMYIYHNRIDQTGDVRDTETRVFSAAEEALDELVELTNKLVNANVAQVFITADHGFLYQHTVPHSDYADVDLGDKADTRAQRYVIGHDLDGQRALMHVAEVPGLAIEGEAYAVRTCNQLRLQGAGKRYVHGGATLQEALLPVVIVNVRRAKATAPVPVEILRGETQMITSGQITVKLYQAEPVGVNVLARTLRVGLYSLTGELLSDRHEICFDLDSPNARERELTQRLLLARVADSYNGQEVEVRLEEREGNTAHYVTV